MSSLIISSRLLLSLLLLVGFCLSLEPPPFPDYASLDTMESSKLHLEPTFQKACKEMAGYYSDPHKDPRLKKTILIGAINNAYREFYHNYKCFMDLFGIKFLTLALDSDVYQYLKEKNVS